MFINDNNNFKEGIVWWDQKCDPSQDVDIFFFIHDYDGVAKYKYGFKTLHINLEKSIDDIKNDMKPNLRNELRKAEDMDFEIKVISDISDDQINQYVEAYNSFADFKKLQKTSFELIKQMVRANKIQISQILKNDEIIIWHSHYIGHKHPRLYQSFSTLNSLTPKESGYANKFLTLKDIERYKEQGFKIYDFGGIGNVEGDNTKFEGIIKFKKSFGGKEIVLWKGATPNGANGEEIYKKYFK